MAIIPKSILREGEFNELRNLISEGKRNFSKEVLKSAVYLHPANLNPPANANITYSATADYIFRCDYCAEMGLPFQWYKIILDEVGGSPMFHQRSRVSDLEKGFTGENLAKIPDGDKTEYFNSSINLLEGKGYICDHCRDCQED